MTHDQAAWLAGRWRHVRATTTNAGYGLWIEGLDPMVVECDGRGVTIRRQTFDARPEPGLLEEAILGPALLLALATRGTFALHASAIELDGHAYAFLGMSGEGKSTLAKPSREPGCRIADDILPVSWHDDAGARAWPRYPQLKVGRLDSRGQPLVERLPLGGLFLLDGRSSATCDVQCEWVPAMRAAVALTRHTVASRLFGPSLMRNQLAFVAALVRHVPVARLGYARRSDALPGVRRFVASRARALANDAKASPPRHLTPSNDGVGPTRPAFHFDDSDALASAFG